MRRVGQGGYLSWTHRRGSIVAILPFPKLHVQTAISTLAMFARDLFATSFIDPDYFDRRFGPGDDAYAAWLLARTPCRTASRQRRA